MRPRVLRFERYPDYLRQLWWRTYVPWRLRSHGVCVGRWVRIYGSPIVSVHPGSSISIGDRVALCSSAFHTALGVNHPVILRTLNHGAEISIGNDVGLSGVSICAAVSVTIGEQCLIGANATIVDTDFHQLQSSNRRYNPSRAGINTKAVKIGPNVFVGMGAMILKGVSIGENSIIGAGAVVSKDVPPNSIAAGNPAIVIKEIDGAS